MRHVATSLRFPRALLPLLRQGGWWLLWIVLGGALGWAAIHVLVPTLVSRGAHQSDVYWSWVLGRWEVVHRRVYTENLPRLNGRSAAGWWVNLEWGWQAMLGLLAPHRLATRSLWFFLWGTGLLFVAVFWGLLRRWYPPHLLTPLIAVLGWLMLVLAGDWPLRPQILSAAFWLGLLAILAVSTHRPRWVWALLPLWLLWSQVHGDWILVPLLLAWQIGWIAWRVWQDPTLKAWGIRQAGHVLAVFAVGLGWVIAISPFHLATLATAIHLSGSPMITRTIEEWQPPFWDNAGWTLIALLWAAVVLAWQQGRTPPGPWMGWWAGTVLATLWHQRMILYNLPLTLFLAGSWILSMPASPRRARTGVALGLAAVLLWPWASGRDATTYARALVSPAAAVAAWCRTHPTPGITLTPYRLGGVWEAAGVPRVYLDGRTLWWIQHHRFQTYLAWQDGTASVAALARQGVTRIVWATTAHTPQMLWLERAHWHPVYHGDGLTVWQP